jgi:hypothetical protein
MITVARLDATSAASKASHIIFILITISLYIPPGYGLYSVLIYVLDLKTYQLDRLIPTSDRHINLHNLST